MGRVRLGDTADVAIDAFPGRAISRKGHLYLARGRIHAKERPDPREDRVKLVFGVKSRSRTRRPCSSHGLPPPTRPSGPFRAAR